MILDYIGVKEINGSLIVIDNVENAFYEETVDIRLDDGSMRQGRIVQMDGKRVVIQVFEGSREISLDNPVYIQETTFTLVFLLLTL